MKKRVSTFISIVIALCCIAIAIVVPSILSAQYKKYDYRLASIINSEVEYKFNYKNVNNDSPQLEKLSTKIILRDAQLNEISTVKSNDEDFILDVDATGLFEANENGSETYTLSYKEFNINGKKTFKQTLTCTYIPYAKFVAIDGNKNDFHYKDESVYINSTKYEAINIWISAQATNYRSYSLIYNLITFENGLIIHYFSPALSFSCEDPEIIEKIDLICQEQPTLNDRSQ